MKQVAHRYFFALDLDSTIEKVSSQCHLCASVSKFQHFRVQQSTESPPEGIGVNFACDVLRRETQFIFVLRETVTSYTWTKIIANEKKDTLLSALIQLIVHVKPLHSSQITVRVDPAPGFTSLKTDPLLAEHGIMLDIGRSKNTNKNPVAERAVQELEYELVKQNPRGGSITDALLATATSQLNSRLRYSGLSAREMLFQRDQFSNHQIPVCDVSNIATQHNNRKSNHAHSEKAKAPLKLYNKSSNINIGDLVYVNDDYNKHKPRDRYIVTNIDSQFVHLRKFAGNQFRLSTYKVKPSQCIKVSDQIEPMHVGQHFRPASSDSEDDFIVFDQVTPTTNSSNEQLLSDTAVSPLHNGNSDEMPHTSNNLETQFMYDEFSEWPRRERRHPKRLDITSWSGKSYDI